VKALLALLVCTSVAHAYPVFDLPEDEPVDPGPLTKLGFRIGGARIPLAEHLALGAMSLAIGVDHEVWGETRVIAEYECLYLSETTDDPEMAPVFTGMGHRTHLGLRRALATKTFENIRFYIDGEAGGGLALLETPTGGEVLPHGFVGMRAGYQLTKQRARGSRVLETEIQFRAIAVEHGVGFGGGLGFWWGD
jgi:hypothetical protein